MFPGKTECMITDVKYFNILLRCTLRFPVLYGASVGLELATGNRRTLLASSLARVVPGPV